MDICIAWVVACQTASLHSFGWFTYERKSTLVCRRYIIPPHKARRNRSSSLLGSTQRSFVTKLEAWLSEQIHNRGSFFLKKSQSSPIINTNQARLTAVLFWSWTQVSTIILHETYSLWGQGSNPETDNSLNTKSAFSDASCKRLLAMTYQNRPSRQSLHLAGWDCFSCTPQKLQPV